MINQASAFNAACAASYLEDYLDCVETLPHDIQRHVTRIRELDAEYYESLRRIQSLRDNLCNLLGSDSEQPTSSDNGRRQSSFASRKESIINSIKSELIYGQSLSDQQLQQLDALNEILEVKVRTLDQESRNLESGISENLFKTNNILSPTLNSTSSAVQNNRHGPSSAPKSEPQCNSIQNSQEKPASNSRYEKRNSIVSCNNVQQNNNHHQSSEDSETSNNNSRTSSSTPCHVGLKNSTGHKRSKRLKQASNTPQKRIENSTADNHKHKDTNSATNLKEKIHNNNSKDHVRAGSEDSQDRLINHSSVHKNAANHSTASQRRRKKGTTANKDDKETDQQPVTKHSKMKYNLPPYPNEPTYCLCEQVSYGEMIGCDNIECEIEWYHFECVNLCSKPKGKWYCPNCRGDRSNVMKE